MVPAAIVTFTAALLVAPALSVTLTVSVPVAVAEAT